LLFLDEPLLKILQDFEKVYHLGPNG